MLTRIVSVGSIPLGGDHPIRIQSMTSVPTLDTVATVQQIIRIKEAGGDYVRLATRSIREAAHLSVIKRELRKRGCEVPIIADVHFNPQIAETAARIAAKVRINPGNYVSLRDVREKASVIQDFYVQEQIYRQLEPLIRICKEYGTALRLGSNHGSLSQRIMSIYGDTPLGMVESALEFARVCRQENFNDLVISMKSSNTRVMIHATRLLVQKMTEEGMDYPVHLGVTEAGEGEDGRIKSAIGIGTLLQEGIGDTIRVSLTEEPEHEIPVARGIIEWGNEKREARSEKREVKGDGLEYQRRETFQVGDIGGGRVPIVATKEPITGQTIRVKPDALSEEMIDKIKADNQMVLIAECDDVHGIDDLRNLFGKLDDSHCLAPVIIKMNYPRMDPGELLIRSAVNLGGLLIDGLADGIWIQAEGQDRDFIDRLSFGILQGSRARFTRAEFIACPSCGRTLFNIQDTVRIIHQRLGHLKNIRIAVMGCIVNGPGEMADADYGYVGAGKGKINLYKGKSMIKRNVNVKDALSALEQLIRESGDWDE